MVDKEKGGEITLTFLKDDIEARGDFFPPQPGGLPITDEYLRAFLIGNNIEHGICHEEIENARKRCLDEGEIVRDVLIARGEPPIDTEPEHLQLNPLYDEEDKVKEGSTVDHRDRSPFIIVKKGQALAKLKHVKHGRDGTNVHGGVINHKIRQAPELKGGENTMMEGRFLVSSIYGQLVLSRGEVSVRETLIIKGPVGYSTGHIIFPGSIQIDGPVSDGFKIYSGGSLTIRQTFDVTDTIIKDNLRVSGGIIGRGRARVKVGGTLRTKFIENCAVTCRKTVAVDAEIINSKVFTMEAIEMGEKGRIVGGEIHAIKGVRTGSIGQKRGKAARIYCGVNFMLQREMEKTNGYLKTLAIKINRIRNLLDSGRMEGEEKRKIGALFRRLQYEQRKAQVKVSGILGKLNAFEDAVVEVKGEITAGTVIEICQVSLHVIDPMKNVRIRFNRQYNRLTVEDL